MKALPDSPAEALDIQWQGPQNGAEKTTSVALLRSSALSAAKRETNLLVTQGINVNGAARMSPFYRLRATYGSKEMANLSAISVAQPQLVFCHFCLKVVLPKDDFIFKIFDHEHALCLQF